MSSIMRCRSGLMALSVIGDAPVLMEVVETPSQDRTPRGAILFAVPPAAANYRASGLVLWHETVMPLLSPHVRCEGVSGPSSVAIRGPSLLRVSDAGQRHRRDIHQWPASESRQGKNPREMAGGGAASTERYGGLRTTELGEGKRGR